MSGSPSPTLDPAILSYYERRTEEDRLRHGLSQLETLRTRRLIERFASPPPGVLDVGAFAQAEFDRRPK